VNSQIIVVARAMLGVCAVKSLAFIAALVACGTPPSDDGVPLVIPKVVIPPPPPPRPEVTAVVVSRDVRVVTSELEGRIKLDVAVGDRVHAGAVLAKLDVVELQAGLAAAQAEEAVTHSDVLSASAEVTQQERQLRIEKRLADLGAARSEGVKTTSDQLVLRKGRVQTATARYAAAKARRIALERQLAGTDIVAASDGVITEVKTTTGDIVHKGAPIAEVSDPEHVRLQFAIPADVDVRIGARIEATVDRRQVRGTVRRLTDPLAPDHLIVVEADLDERAELGATGKIKFL
jgi:multidrug efflux pump subunit AcrA (membrane-fusion protein)